MVEGVCVMNNVEVGQYYRVMDNRFIRYVVVYGTYRDKVYLQTVGGPKRFTKAKIERFNGKHGGYKLVPVYEVEDYLLERSR